MRAFIFAILFFICVSPALTQSLGPGLMTPPVGDALFLRDYFTTPFQGKAKYADVDGSPFVDDDWALARVYVDSVQFFDSIKIRINAFENRIHYLNDANEEFQAMNRFREIVITGRSSKLFGSVFRSGFLEQPQTYFQILADGPKAQLLQKIKVEKWSTKAAFEESKVIFQHEKELFFATKKSLVKQNKDCTDLKDLTADDKDVLQFIRDNALKCNKEADMKRVVYFINSK
jgi:hypothetical protein